MQIHDDDDNNEDDDDDETGWVDQLTPATDESPVHPSYNDDDELSCGCESNYHHLQMMLNDVAKQENRRITDELQYPYLISRDDDEDAINHDHPATTPSSLASFVEFVTTDLFPYGLGIAIDRDSGLLLLKHAPISSIETVMKKKMKREQLEQRCTDSTRQSSSVVRFDQHHM